MPRLKIGMVGDLADGDCATVSGCGKTVSVFRTGESYYAIDDACPHMGASLGGGHVEDGIVTCPWHYWRFRLSDGAWADNPKVKIGSYPVEIVGQAIEIVIPDEAAPKAS